MRNGEAIARALRGHRENGAWKFYCPIHEPLQEKGHKPSCSIRDSDGLVTCFAGCNRKAVEAKLDELGFTDDGKRPSPADHKALRAWENERIKKARALWQLALTANDEWSRREVQSYLWYRGISLPPPPVMRWAWCWYVVPIVTLNGRVTAIHSKLWGKGGAPNRTIGCPRDGAVHLAEPANGELGLAEGVETALSASQLHGGLPCWAVLSAHRFERVQLPPQVRRVHLFGDNDAAGRDNIARAVERYTRQDRRVTVHWPPSQFNDWNDCLCGKVSS